MKQFEREKGGKVLNNLVKKSVRGGITKLNSVLVFKSTAL